MGLKRTTNRIYIISLVVNNLKSYVIVKDDAVESGLAYFFIWSDDFKCDKHGYSYEIAFKKNIILLVIWRNVCGYNKEIICKYAPAFTFKIFYLVKLISMEKLFFAQQISAKIN